MQRRHRSWRQPSGTLSRKRSRSSALHTTGTGAWHWRTVRRPCRSVLAARGVRPWPARRRPRGPRYVSPCARRSMLPEAARNRMCRRTGHVRTGRSRACWRDRRSERARRQPRNRTVSLVARAGTARGHRRMKSWASSRAAARLPLAGDCARRGVADRSDHPRGRCPSRGARSAAWPR